MIHANTSALFSRLARGHSLGPGPKAEWVAALRSGAYPEGSTELCEGYDPTWSCLGVGGDVLVDADWYWGGTRGTWALGAHGTRVLDPKLLDCLEAGDRWSRVFAGLATINDAGVSFADLADLIEVHL
jgi:hypothetical protein